MLAKSLTLVAAYAVVVSAQTYQRLGTCPTLGCILPPDQQDFLPGQFFDLRFEVHAPLNGSEAYNNGEPDEDFSATITTPAGETKSIAEFFSVEEPELETWDFSWYEDLFAEDAGNATVVNVASKIYRKIALYTPGDYTVTLAYYDGSTTEASWTVRPIAKEKKAKNVIFFIGDGMTTNMITAARLIGHKSVNGRYQSLLAMDDFPIVGHQMTHSIDSFITDSANSASALYTGHKSSVNALGVYADSSEDTLDDPKVETIAELFMRIWDGAWGAVSTASIADATPIALLGHSRSRYDYGALVDMTLNGVANYSWVASRGPDVWLGGGAEVFYPGEDSFNGGDYYAAFAEQGYQVALNKTSLEAASSDDKLLGIFCQSHLPVWLDRNVFRENLKDFENDPLGSEDAAVDLPGLKEMTLKAVDVLVSRGSENGFFLMSEAASIDKQMHTMDYDRALGDLLELDDAVRATAARLEELGILGETQIIVSADHGHGFDVWGSADTKYLSSRHGDREKRRAVGTYASSGLGMYAEGTDGISSYGTGANFPANWDPRYALAQGFGAAPDHRENYKVHKDGPRTPAEELVEGDYYANPEDAVDGFLVNGTLPADASTGVHSLTDVPVYAMGPCQHLFQGTYMNIDVFYKMAECLGLAWGEERDVCDKRHWKSGKRGNGRH
ncbi:hypothetical protein MKZ38_003859 [Zalerion maritima]|uniref:alkaline phosphatase n=1 Tax=Zalerion maritima TaxID=339359 RepID=A0AAD5RN72_9PEZI|nr:hypothetical protein MKZ38_003859 [Zalerion maritima]